MLSMTFITYNVNSAGPGAALGIWNETRRWNIKKAIDENNADIVGFQEALSRTGQQNSLDEIFIDTK